ncbi:SsgA family sporulation/cell division regulator [Solihabitans fulvus]|uniref:SsgA family sporulation/cell division regulator n=1 Tax=Solihabitans fulvus TaxID=1892852 RepID=A0A5B2XLA7_9PSEU|nr:SsgA family sporulation/cell division regulator [Solihabitans fulvus]KAA2264648.1 SsgA family sporulation/cell division regulator [Solihabitans fulvus]
MSDTSATNDHTAINATMTFGLLAPGTPAVPIDARLRYDTEDPYAMGVRFHTGQGVVEWMFARELLADGLIAAAGEGDIRVRPSTEDPELVLVELVTPGGHAVLTASAEDLADFLDRSYDLVPPGDEHLWVDFDEELARLASTN